LPEAVGRTLVIFICLCMFLSGLVLLVADRLELGRERGRGIGGTLASGVPPLVALIASVL
jgi:putative membrane protein